MSAYSSLILAHANLVSYWRLGEAAGSAIDQKGSINGAYGAGNVTRAQPGLIFQDGDGSVLLNSAGPGTVTFGDFYDFTGVTPFTIELWVRPTNISGSPTYLISKADSVNNGWWIDAFNGGTRFRRGDAVGFDGKTGPAMVNGSINHLVYAYDGTQILPYVNGVAVAAQASVRNIVDSTTQLTLGADWNPSTGTSGYFDELAIYNAAISPADVLSHFNQGVAQAPTLRTIRSPYVLA